MHTRIASHSLRHCESFDARVTFELTVLSMKCLLRLMQLMLQANCCIQSLSFSVTFLILETAELVIRNVLCACNQPT